MERRSSTEQLTDLFPEVIRPHQRLTDEEAPRPGALKGQDIVPISDTALGDERCVGSQLSRQAMGDLQIGPLGAQVSIVDAQDRTTIRPEAVPDGRLLQ